MKHRAGWSPVIDGVLDHEFSRGLNDAAESSLHSNLSQSIDADRILFRELGVFTRRPAKVIPITWAAPAGWKGGQGQLPHVR